MITLYKDTFDNYINSLTGKDIFIELYNFTSRTFGNVLDKDEKHLEDLLYRTNENPLDRLIKLISISVKQNLYDIQYKIHSNLKPGQLLVNSTTLNVLLDNIIDEYDYKYTLENMNIYENSKMSYEGQYAKHKLLGSYICTPNDGVLVAVGFNTTSDLVVNIYAKEIIFPMIIGEIGFNGDYLAQLNDYLKLGIENSLVYLDEDYFTYYKSELHIFREGNEVDWQDIEDKITKHSEEAMKVIDEKVETLIRNDLHIDTPEKAEWILRELIRNGIREVNDVCLIPNKMPNDNELKEKAIENQKKFIKKYLTSLMIKIFNTWLEDKKPIKITLSIRNNKKDTKNNIVGFENFQASTLRKVNKVIINIERVYPKSLYEALIEIPKEIKEYNFSIGIIILDKEITDEATLKKIVYEEYKEEQ